MKKKIIGIVVCMLLIISGLFLPKTTVSSGEPLSTEVLDQAQEICGECEFFNNYAWQEFVPTQTNLVRVEVCVAQFFYGSPNITLSIEHPLETSLTSTSLPASGIPNQVCDWVSFDVPDITLIPGETYYIVLSYPPGGEYSWGGASGDLYVPGDSNREIGWDWCFRTLGALEEITGPDLVVTDIWNEGGAIWYQLFNRGNVPADPGHASALYVDDVYQTSDDFSEMLNPGERINRVFTYQWECTPLSDTIEVRADVDDIIAESNETNNNRLEQWNCDTVPPEITSGPLVQNITQDSAMISWETNEDSDSRVSYGAVSGVYDYDASNESFSLVHQVLLSELTPSTTYQFHVHSADLTGNSIQSSDVFFETAAALDGIPPTVDVEPPGDCQQSVLISANAADNQGVEKVIFFINDAPVFTDFSAPFEFLWDTTAYPNGLYDVKTRVVDLMGQTSEDHVSTTVANLVDETVPEVRIVYPHNGDTLTGDVLITAYLQDDVDLKEAVCYIDGVKQACTLYPQQINYVGFTYLWDSYDVGNGPHRIGIVASDSDGKNTTGYVDVLVDNPPKPQPDLKVLQHSVSQYHNRATIKVIVQNVGASTARNVTVIDYLSGFLPVSDDWGSVNYTTKYDPANKISSCVIKDSVDLLPNEVRQYEYYAIPILFHPLSGPSIGFILHLDYETTYHEKIIEAVPFAVNTKDVNDAYNNALMQADYLLLTNPQRLFDNFGGKKGGDQNVYTLLSTMAELAYFRNGILGFVNTMSSNVIRNLIIPGGLWEAKIHSQTNQLQYLLLVGETEIVPSWHQMNFNLTWSNSACITKEVDLSDLFYANTVGDGAPELTVGRIIGNDPVKLAHVMQTSINVLTNQSGYGFDRSHALLISGTGSGVIQLMFSNFVNDSANILKYEFIVDKLHYYQFPWNQWVNEFRTRALDQDVICYQGHGSPDGMCVTTDNFSQTPPISFGNTNPVVIAYACLTGSYENHTANTCHFDGGDYNIAEAFLDANAGVYIGSTEVSPIEKSYEAGKFFFNLWKSGAAVGDILRMVKYNTWSQSDSFWQLWSTEYNLYGDPKYGADSTASGTSFNEESASFVDVHIPAYNVLSRDGYDYVDIPDGNVLLKDGSYRIPFYIVSYQYPHGVKIQDVRLTTKTNPSIASGLNLPIVNHNIGCCDDPLPPDAPPINEWYPYSEYEWNVDENTNGSSTLHILIYPMKYNPLTTALQFYRNYSFAINFTESPLTIVTMNMDNDEYHSGDLVTVNVEMNNTGDSQDVIVNAIIKQSGTENIIDGLLLSTLHDFHGSASFAPQWNSENTPPGYYYVEVTLSDTQGRLLDRKTSLFGLDLVAGNVTAFSVSPQYFNIGDIVSIETTFSNTGSVGINGTAYTNIQDMNGSLVQTFSHTITDLQPVTAISYTDQWDSSGAPEGSYKVISYVLYESQSSNTMVQLISTNYPPIVHFTYTPQPPILLEEPVQFTTAGSMDPDGSIVSWAWDFGDGSLSTEQNPTHAYHHPGNYTVSLTITDNKGATNITETFLIIGDFTPPSITIEIPGPWEALQDGVTFRSQVIDPLGVSWVKYSIREPGGTYGTIIDPMYETLNASAAADNKWEFLFDTTQLPDGHYVLYVNASDTCGNEGNTTGNFSIRNWAVLEMLPNTPNSKAGRTMPVKFSLRITAAVDPAQPFVRNEELTIKIYIKGYPGTILQISTYGPNAKDYRINSTQEHYITNFKTLSTPKTYVVEIWRNDLLIGSFEFTTVK